MNTDMYLDPCQQCLAKMVRFMDQHRDCGLATCRLYHPDGTYGWPARRFQTLRTIAARRLPVGKMMKAEVDRYLYKHESPFDSFACDWVSGCFMFVRREAALAVGGFDTGFVKYFEDVDFCLRMARAGWRVMFHGGTYCYHCEQRASRKLISRDAWLHMRSYMRWLAKWGLSPRVPGEVKKAA
jgi:GT2 family glycosyltransferase